MESNGIKVIMLSNDTVTNWFGAHGIINVHIKLRVWFPPYEHHAVTILYVVQLHCLYQPNKAAY